MATRDNAKEDGELRPEMSVAEFDAGYYYAAELKKFARSLGITVGNFRKHEVEELIRERLTTGRVPDRRPVPSRRSRAPRDVLTADGVVANYVDDRATKDFLRQLVLEQAPELKDKSGQWYWLNDWRRAQQAAGRRFRYGDLAARLRELMCTEGRLPQIPSARMNNFVTDFRADPANEGITHDDVMAAWHWLKDRPGPNTYLEYRRLRTISTRLHQP